MSQSVVRTHVVFEWPPIGTPDAAALWSLMQAEWAVLTRFVGRA